MLSEQYCGYDQFGNMWVSASSGVSLAGNTPTANVFSNNRISGASYDAAGNQLSVNGDALAYDAENRQISATEPASLGGGTEGYFYDGDGQRVEKSGPGGITIYVYDAFGQMQAEYSSEPADMALCQACYLTYDHLGNLRMVTDAYGNVVARHDFLPFGEELQANTAGRGVQWGPQADTIDQRFTGQNRDSETGEDFFNARYFTGALGRFNSPDPANAGADIMDPQTWNGYSYVRNNPLALTDPSGQFALSDLFSGLWGAISDFGGAILNWFDPPCGADFCATGTGVSDINTVSVGGAGGLILGGSGGAGVAGSGGAGSATFSVTGTGVANRNPQPVQTPSNLQLLPAKSGTCAVSPTSLDNYLGTKHSHMVGQGTNLLNAGQKFNLDPRLFVSIAGAETTFGKNITAGQYNAFNVLYNGLNSPFSSWQSAINSVGRSLTNPRNGYDLTNTATMYQTYCTSGSTCAAGLKNINTFMQEQLTNINALRFPCQK